MSPPKPGCKTGVEETKLLKAVGIDYRHDFPAWPDVAAHIPLAYIEGGEFWEISGSHYW